MSLQHVYSSPILNYDKCFELGGNHFMKICIVTLYNSLNYGAYLQAYALDRVLKEFKGEVSFLKTKARKPIKSSVKSMSIKAIKFQFKEARFELLKLANSRNAIKIFNICNKEEVALKSKDIFVFGSDEIWNISRKEISNHPILFGVGIPDNYFVSYAPSINITDLEQIKQNTDFQNAIERFDRLSVRDYHSFNTLKKITSKEIEVVLDPTFLLSKDIYSELEEECKERDFILVYIYEQDIKEEEIKRIKEFAQSVNLELISVGFYNNWCDKRIPASPFKFLSYIKNSKFVITNTFHGTIFSIIYNKQFVTYAGKKVKVIDVLERLNLQKRNVSNHPELRQIIEEKINYDCVKHLLDKEIKDSYEYIEDFIDQAKKN